MSDYTSETEATTPILTTNLTNLTNLTSPGVATKSHLNRAERRRLKKQNHIATMAETNKIADQRTESYNRIYSEVYEIMKKNVSVRLTDEEKDEKLDETSEFNELIENTVANLTKRYIVNKINSGQYLDLLNGNYDDLKKSDEDSTDTDTITNADAD